jgi:hypothetical protein
MAQAAAFRDLDGSLQPETEALRAENRLIEEVEAERARLTAPQMFRRSIRDVSVVTDG